MKLYIQLLGPHRFLLLLLLIAVHLLVCKSTNSLASSAQETVINDHYQEMCYALNRKTDLNFSEYLNNVKKNRIYNQREAFLRSKMYSDELLLSNNPSNKQLSHMDERSATVHKAAIIRHDQNPSCYLSLMEQGPSHPFLVEIIQAAKIMTRKKKRIIITSGDDNYRGLAMNWAAMMNNIDIREYLVICFSESLFKILGSWDNGGHGIMMPGCISFQEFAYVKLIVMHTMVNAEYVTVWSDSDCIWLEDFFDKWIWPYENKVDFLGQRGNHPMKYVNMIGISLCTGLLVIFPTKNSIVVLETVLCLIPIHQHFNCDQLLINMALKNLGSYELDGHSKFRMSSVNVDVTPSEKAPVVGFLPFRPFMRTPDQTLWTQAAMSSAPGLLSIWHLQSPKNSEAKISLLENMHLFTLHPGWVNVTTHQQLPNFIDPSRVMYPPWRRGIPAVQKMIN